MSRLILCALLLLLAQGCLGAYITDKLLAGFYASPDLTSEPLRALPNDTPMEILEEAGNLSRVRLGDNSEGWVETRFITREKPARMMLLELQAKYASLKRQVDNSAGGQQIETPDNPDSKLKENPIRVPVQLSAVPDKQADQEQEIEAAAGDTETQQLRRENADLKERIRQLREFVPTEAATQQRPDSLQPWLLPLIMFVMLLGFIAGIAFKNYRLAGRARQAGPTG